jgi:hypothetical protein
VAALKKLRKNLFLPGAASPAEAAVETADLSQAVNAALLKIGMQSRFLRKA